MGTLSSMWFIYIYAGGADFPRGGRFFHVAQYSVVFNRYLFRVLTNHLANATRGLSISWQALATLYRFGIWSHGRTLARVISSSACALRRYGRKILYIRKRKTRAHIGIAIGLDGLCRRVLMMRPPHGLGLAVEHREYDYYRAGLPVGRSC